MTLDGITPAIGANWSALEARLTVDARRRRAVRAAPAAALLRQPADDDQRSAIATRLDGQLYTVLGQPDGQGRWQLRLWWKPFVTLIWLGGVLIALGGALSLVGRLRRERRAALREAWA